MFFWTSTTVSPLFSTLLLLKEYSSSQHFSAYGKQDQYSFLESLTGSAFAPHYKGLIASH